MISLEMEIEKHWERLVNVVADIRDVHGRSFSSNKRAQILKVDFKWDGHNEQFKIQLKFEIIPFWNHLALYNIEIIIRDLVKRHFETSSFIEYTHLLGFIFDEHYALQLSFVSFVDRNRVQTRARCSSQNLGLVCRPIRLANDFTSTATCLQLSRNGVSATRWRRWRRPAAHATFIRTRITCHGKMDSLSTTLAQRRSLCNNGIVVVGNVHLADIASDKFFQPPGVPWNDIS